MWTDSFLKTSFLDRQNFVVKNFQNVSIIDFSFFFLGGGGGDNNLLDETGVRI